jgi:hypothetical protein
MELAIPLIALGGMYIISNQSNNNQRSKKEKFSTMGKNPNYLPNVYPPPQNYPVTNINQLEDTVHVYSNPNTATDKYFDQTAYENRVDSGKRVGQNPQSIYSLTGNYLDSAQFKHNNMVPFEGGKIKGYTYDVNIAESILDNMNGSGSQIIKKIEQAPLFKPEDNVQWAYGAPNNSDFFQSRVNPGMWNNNVKNFNSENVGPGLNQGYTTTGSGGYNSGMEARDYWLPKTVDELRVVTNPKLEYTQVNLEGPANSLVKNLGILGRVEKQHPDTFFINTQDRWLTTTGAEKGETLRPIQELGLIRRNDVVNKYVGPAGNDGQSSYAPSNFEPSKRNDLPIMDVPSSNAVGRGPIDDGDNNFKSHTNYINNRSKVSQPDSIRSGFSGAIGAVIAPILDILRPSKKEEVVNNVRIYGDARQNVASGYVINPNDITSTTIRETTVYSPQFNINNQKDGIYVNNYTPTDLTQRDTTNCSTLGNVGGKSNQEGNVLYEAAYRQTNNEIKSSDVIYNRTNHGNTQLFNNHTNVQIKKMSPECNSNIFSTANSVIKRPPSKYTYGKVNVPQYYNECVGCDRIDGDLLQAFRNNPYTHSLTSSV